MPYSPLLGLECISRCHSKSFSTSNTSSERDWLHRMNKLRSGIKSENHSFFSSTFLVHYVFKHFDIAQTEWLFSLSTSQAWSQHRCGTCVQLFFYLQVIFFLHIPPEESSGTLVSWLAFKSSLSRLMFCILPALRMSVLNFVIHSQPANDIYTKENWQCVSSECLQKMYGGQMEVAILIMVSDKIVLFIDTLQRAFYFETAKT